MSDGDSTAAGAGQSRPDATYLYLIPRCGIAAQIGSGFRTRTTPCCGSANARPTSLLHLAAQDGEAILGCLDPNLDMVTSVTCRGDNDLLAGLIVDDHDFFVNAAGQ